MTVRSRVDVDPNFELQVRALRAAFGSLADATLTGGQPRWMTPELLGWSGDTEDREGMSAPFARDQANAQFVEAVADPLEPGTTADLVAATTMIDWLACMERAYRARHTMPRNRAALHAASRYAGHASEQGALTTCALEYVRRIVRQAKGDTGEAPEDGDEA